MKRDPFRFAKIAYETYRNEIIFHSNKGMHPEWAKLSQNDREIWRTVANAVKDSCFVAMGELLERELQPPNYHEYQPPRLGPRSDGFYNDEERDEFEKSQVEALEKALKNARKNHG